MKSARVALAVLAVCLAIAWLLTRGDDAGEAEMRPATLPRPSQTAPEFEAKGTMPAPQPVAMLPLEVGTDAEQAEAVATVLIVRHADGAPARGGIVVLAMGNKAVWSEVTDDDGEAQGAPVAGPAVAWVGGVTLAPVSFPLEDAQGRHELTLPAGETIDGRIVIDGGPPPEPVPLWLTPVAETDLPASVREALTPWRPGKPRLEGSSEGDLGALVGGDGSFRFSGLPAGWVGRFNVPYTWFPDEDAHLAVRAPERGRLLHLHRIPHLRFRVLNEGSRAPAAFAVASVTRSGSASTNADTFVCDALGRADVPLLRWEPTFQVTLALASADGTARTLVQRDLEDSTHDVDLGDIELSSRLSIPFRVTEPDGTPIAGAVAATECETLIRSGDTDPDGLGRLDGVPPGCAEMRVGAARHEPARVALPAQPPSAPLNVTLTPCAWLSLRVLSDDGAPRPALTLLLETSRRVSAGDADSSFFDEALRMGIRVASGSGSQSGTESHAQPDGSQLRKTTMAARLWKLGDFELGCMEPGQPVSLRLVDDAQSVLWADEVVLQAGEQRQMEAVVSAHAQPIEVLVTDESGNPVEDAAVQIRATGSDGERYEINSRRESTDADGRASFAAVYTPSVDVRCEKDGYLTATLCCVVPNVPSHVLLRRGLEATVSCIDGKGRPVIVDGVWAVQGATTMNGDAVDPQQDEDGRPNRSSVYHLEGLAHGPMSVGVNVGGRSFAFDRQASEDEIKLVLPESGALVVRGLQAAKGVEQAYLRVGLQSDEKVYLTGWIGLGEISRDEKSWPVVFPGTYRVEIVAGEDQHVVAGPAFVDVKVGATTEVSLH